ncbi:MAG: hypothetical protein IK117_03680, partial [Bacteroidales bacterium]|nr:hypothetical protein [Bacteroidales bacterium]
MKRFSIISTILVIFSLYSFAQKDVIISGGNHVSAVVCSNNYVFVAGENKVTYGTGVLGVGSSEQYVSRWTQVNFPNNTTVQQVSSCGAHFVALDCQYKVWCWGLNIYGQCGQDTVDSRITSQPMQVPAGVLEGTEYDDGGYLSNVAVVSAGNCNSFAILGPGAYEGMVVAWGGNINDNYVSSLGDGTTTNQISPVWCIDLNGNHVQNIVQVFASDNAAMLLDEDGHVWTAGGGMYPSTLGRKATGGYAATASTTGSSKFGMVYVAENEPLSDIVQIAAGGVNCQALDKDGYVWGWGDAWNNATGVGETGSPYPKKVVAGLLGSDDTDGTYLLAKSIRAGQSCGYAVSKTNKPVMWGTFGSSGSSTSNLPRYIEYASGKIHNDVISIDQGKLCLFYCRADGDMYAYGNNEYGQMGNGSSTNFGYATKMNPPAACNSFKDPYPTASISPRNVTACAASTFEGVTLDCGFTISKADLLSSYTITWYKDGTQVQTGNASKVTYKTPAGEDGIGNYRVVVKYVGANGGCQIYDDAEDEITISALQQEFSIPSVTYCGDEATVNVTPSNSTAEYTWYANQSATAELGKSIGDEEITIDLSGIYPSNSYGDKTIYVKETSSGAGSLIPGTKAQRTASNIAINQQIPSIGVTVSENTTFLSTSLYLLPVLQGKFVTGDNYNTREEAEAQIQTLTGNVTITIRLCGTKTQNGKLVANTSDIKKAITKTLPYSYDVSPSDIVQNPTFNSDGTTTYTYQPRWNSSDISLPIELVEIPIDTTLASDVYYFAVFGSVSGNISTNNTKFYVYNGSLVGSVDDMNGAVSIYGADEYGNYTTSKSGPLFDFKLKSNVGYCAVVPVTISEECPCSKPSEFSINCDDAVSYSNGVIAMCEGSSCTLTTSEWATSGSNFDYIWYKDGEIVQAPAVANTSSGFEVTSAGEYKILVRDKNAPDALSCNMEKSVTVVENPIPEVYITADKARACQGETITLTASSNLSGATYVWGSGGTEATQTVDKTATYTVSATVNGCTSTTDSTITIYEIPNAPVVEDATYCYGDAPEELSAMASYEGTLMWYESAMGGVASTTAPWPNTTKVGKTTYYVSQIVDGCESEKTAISVTINELPSISISVDKDEVCAGETITLTADADDSGTFTWSGDGVTENGNTATVTAMPTTAESITVTLNYVSEYNCEAQASATVTFLPVPTAPTAEDVSYCQNETAEMLMATASEGATLLWYESEKSVVASTKAPVPSTATVGDTAFYVSQILNGCESARTEIIATVNSVQTVGIAVDKDEVCVGETVYLMAMPLNGLSYVWFGNGAEIDEHSSGITITPTETMSINLKFTGENGCESEASTTITVKAIPEKPIAQSVSYCQNAVAQILTATADGEQKWYIGDEASTTAPVPNTATVGDTTYYVSQIVNGCESEKTAIKVTV